MKFGTLSAKAAQTDTIVLAYQLASGTGSGASSAATWNTFPLNTELVDTGNLCTLASNRFTLLPGTYEFFDTCFRVFGQNATNIRLRNITDAATVANLACVGSYCDSVTSIEGRNSILGQFAIATSKQFEIQIYTQIVRASSAWGLVSSAATETYGAFGLRRLA